METGRLRALSLAQTRGLQASSIIQERIRYERGLTRMHPRKFFRLPAAVVFFLAPLALYSFAQDPQESSSKHPPVEDDGKSKAAASKDPSQPKYDPLRAEKDIEGGNYYMKNGNIDA